jgi:hypothetical protein
MIGGLSVTKTCAGFLASPVWGETAFGSRKSAGELNPLASRIGIGETSWVALSTSIELVAIVSGL